MSVHRPELEHSLNESSISNKGEKHHSSHGGPNRGLWDRLRAVPQDDFRKVPERELGMRSQGESVLRGRDMRVP